VTAIWIRHDASLAHDIPGHPERPERIVALEAEMDRHDWFGCTRVVAPAASRDSLVAVHTAGHVDFIEDLCARGGGFIDQDTAAVPATWEAALRAAGGASALVDALVSGEARTGVSALRPPGHHAEPDRAMGFCLFANVSIAAEHALAREGVERVFILDWDVHHGNGTNAAFHSRPDVLFCSLHQYPFYPGTGALGDTGSGPGEGYTINLPVPAGSGEPEWLGLVEHVAIPAAREFAPDLILVSAGFDAHRADPLAECNLETDSFRQMALHVAALAAVLGVPVGAVLEGGYDVDALAESAVATMEALEAGGTPRSVERGPLVDAAASALRPA
jgi:acetoin utilization deacetylase AcuC-like enzyme